MEFEFVTPAREFRLSVVSLEGDSPFVEMPVDAVQILLVTEGTCRLEARDHRHILSPGHSCLIPAVLGSFRIGGECRVYKATVPLTPG